MRRRFHTIDLQDFRYGSGRVLKEAFRRAATSQLGPSEPVEFLPRFLGDPVLLALSRVKTIHCDALAFFLGSVVWNSRAYYVKASRRGVPELNRLASAWPIMLGPRIPADRMLTRGEVLDVKHE